MAIRELNPRRLDLEPFATEGDTLEGHWPLAGFTRLATSTWQTADAALAPDVTWSVRGETRNERAGRHDTWLGLRAQADVVLECQRCLAPMPYAIDIDRELRFVADEEAAAQLDAEDEEHDVLVTSRTFDLHEMLEDELLLALPIVPRHEICPQPLVVGAAVDDAVANPFAALAGWKRREPDG